MLQVVSILQTTLLIGILIFFLCTMYTITMMIFTKPALWKTLEKKHTSKSLFPGNARIVPIKIFLDSPKYLRESNVPKSVYYVSIIGRLAFIVIAVSTLTMLIGYIGVIAFAILRG
jgi:hypothetical protein